MNVIRIIDITNNKEVNVKIGDLVTCIDNNFYFIDQGYFIVVEKQLSKNRREGMIYKLRRVSDGYKTGWTGKESWKKV